MATIPLGEMAFGFKCPTCGPTEISVADKDSDDSIANCTKCGFEFGRLGDLRAEGRRQAFEAMKKAAKKAFKR